MYFLLIIFTVVLVIIVISSYKYSHLKKHFSSRTNQELIDDYRFYRKLPQVAGRINSSSNSYCFELSLIQEELESRQIDCRLL